MKSIHLPISFQSWVFRERDDIPFLETGIADDEAPVLVVVVFLSSLN